MRKVFAVLVFTLVAGIGHAGVIDWTDWTASDLSHTTGTAGAVGVDFFGSLAFAQLGFGSMVGGGASSVVDYWTEFAPAPYTGNAVVDNRPPGYELLAFNATSANRLVFDSPVLNPVMAIVSMGRTSVPVTYDFDTPFTLLSEGRGFWGDGTAMVLPGDVLIGRELHAVIQFDGLISDISWTSDSEFWHGFTIGLPGQSVPEPGTLLLVAAGLLGVVRRRRHT